MASGRSPAISSSLDGRDFGPHRGQEAYTLGQRRGLDIPYGTRIYVVAKRGSDVVIGPNEALFSRRVQVRDLNWIPFDVPPEGLRAQAKLRYTPKTAECTVHLTEKGAELCFDEPQRAVTPGTGRRALRRRHGAGRRNDLRRGLTEPARAA